LLLTTFLLLTVFFAAIILGGYAYGEQLKVAFMIGTIGLMIVGLVAIGDGRGIEIEDGKTTITENKTNGVRETTEQITYEEISSTLTQFLQFSTLLGGLALFYSGYNLYYKEPPRSFKRRTRN